MPEISRFFGIVIFIFYNEHNPPHFHAGYGDQKALIDIHTLGILKGGLPPRALGLVMEWATMHKEDLLKCWHQAAAFKIPDKIEPLK
jgi:Domain of unknown function (DUF4160)